MNKQEEKDSPGYKALERDLEAQLLRSHIKPKEGAGYKGLFNQIEKNLVWKKNKTFHIIKFTQNKVSFEVLEDTFADYHSALKYLDKYEVLNSENENNLYLVTDSLGYFLSTGFYDKEKLISLRKITVQKKVTFTIECVHEDFLLEKIQSFCKENNITYKLN
jgi:hypothetical protein